MAAVKKTRLGQYKAIAELRGVEWKACRVLAFSFRSFGVVTSFHYRLMEQEREGVLEYLIFDGTGNISQLVVLERYADIVAGIAKEYGGREITPMLG